MPTPEPTPSKSSLDIRATVPAECAGVLSPEAKAFVAELSRRFEPRRRELLERRKERQQALLRGELPDFLSDTQSVRSGEWKVAPIPADIQNRRVEITGPVDRKMIINALNSGANVFMADFEDANSPTWENVIHGHRNIGDAVREEIEYASPEGKQYKVNANPAVLFIRPRGWHLVEKHASVDDEPVSGSLFDFGLYFFHNAAERVKRGTGVYLYLPKLESHLEARLWNDVFNFAEDRLGLARGTVRGTVLIETILAAFEMEEILYELRDHSAGLNCGRWDYIFSFIKKLGHRREFVLPDRAQVTMDKAFLKAYVDLLIQTCHRRGAHAMGGMAAQIPIKGDPAANDAALDKVRKDKIREVNAGHDGTWVAHPGLVSIAKEIFDGGFNTPNQLHVLREDVKIGAHDLLAVHEGAITEQGLRHNIDVGIQYLEAWLGGLGCVPIYNLMEDAATAEICRAQVWQWLRHGVRLDDGRDVTEHFVRDAVAQQLETVRTRMGADRFDRGHFRAAAEILERLIVNKDFTEFLTLPAYDRLS
jgi:malate synthase